MLTNKIICVGYLGIKRCYLNVNKEDAVKRYLELLGEEMVGSEEQITEFEFTDEFGAYDVYSVG